MAKSKNDTKPKKQRANKYEEKVAINSTFSDVFKVIKKYKDIKKKP